MRRVPVLAWAALLAAGGAAFGEAAQDKVIDVRATRPPAGNSFELLWSTFRKAEAAADTQNAASVFREIRRYRTERNIRALEPVGLALVAEGLERLGKGDRPGAEEAFTGAAGLDPFLPDAYLGLAAAHLKKGPLGFLPALGDTFSALSARLPTSRGRYDALCLAIPIGLLGLFATTFAVAFSLLLRHGTLLLHDLEEAFGPVSGRPAAIAVYVVLLFLPLITFQGWGWLPFWWLALLFTYLGGIERTLAVAVVLGSLAVGPAADLLENRARAQWNPLFQACVQAIEGGPDTRATAELEQAATRFPDDRDLIYLLGIQYKKAGHYDEAASLYREILRTSPDDRVALNNLANIEFARGEFPAAIARYKQGVESSPTPEFTATFYYNLQLAHLQRFEYQPAQEARAQAERLAGSLVRSYDSLWKYDKGDYAVVDLSLTEEQLLAKFDGAREGVAVKNLAGKPVPGGTAGSTFLRSSLTRFAAFAGTFAIVAFGLSRWRGPKMFTLRCHKCGTPFCKHCHLGASTTGLCTQCYHLFVVRDGVAGPARNQKLLEVQKEDERRERVFRILSLVSPGTGHLYAPTPLAGTGFAGVWYLTLASVLLAGRVFPVTEAPGALMERLGLGAAAVILLATYVAANRARPDFEVNMPSPRSTRGRAS
ncbi:MAG: tetratricopeptide repeat protein [Vicinamibacteria bacterium]